jgi:NAD(P)H-hydrate epimerase
LNIIAEKISVLSSLTANTILTPHAKEFDRLTHQHHSKFERLITAIAFAQHDKIVLVLQGTFTAVISSEGDVHFNSTGKSSLAKGGSGDALTGIIAALVAQVYKTLQAAILGVYLHGLSADICIETNTPKSILSSDNIKSLGKEIKKIF